MLIFFYGLDTYRLAAGLQKLKNKFFREVDSSGLNFTRLDGKGLIIDDFRRAVLAPGFLAKKRMIIVENLLTQSKNEALIEEVIKTIKPLEKTQDIILVFKEEQEIKLGQNKTKLKLLNYLKKLKYAQEFSFLKPARLNLWIKKEVAARNGKIDSQAVDLLASYVGNDLWQMSNEIDKLIAYKLDKPIEINDIRLLVKTKIDENIFRLTDAIASKNKKLALKLINEQLGNDVSWAYLLSMIAYQFKNLLRIKSEIGDQGFADSNFLARKFRLPFFVAQKSVEQVQKYSLEELKKIYRQLLEIDLKLKSSQTTPKVIFDLLVANLRN